MKLYLFILISTFLFCVKLNAQWVEQHPIPNPIPGQQYLSVSFVDSLNGWISGNRGVILHTTNGGIHWLQQQSGINSTIRKIRFANPQNGWAVADSGKIINTTDGGETWNIKYDGNKNWHMKLLSVVDELNIYVVGNWMYHNNNWDSTYILLRTSNGGAIWDTLNMILDPHQKVSDIFFITPNKGWYCTWQQCYLCLNGYIFRTLNAGQTWTQQFSSIERRFYTIFFVDENRGWCAGHRGLLSTTNGGANWTEVIGTYYPRQFTLINFVDHNLGWIIETIFNGNPVGNEIKFSSQGGYNLTLQYSSPYNSFIQDICFVEKRIGWAVVEHTGNNNGFILHTPNGGGVFPSPPQLVSPINYQNLSPDSVTLVWNKVSNAIVNYSVNISLDSLFTSTLDTLVTDTSFTITQLEQNKKYYWRVNALNQIGWGAFSRVGTFTTNITGINPEENKLFHFSLLQNFPNPFNPITSLQYAISSRQFVTLKVYDVLGNEIATLVNEEKPAGEYKFEFDGSKLSSGIYFYRLSATGGAGSYVETKKMVLIR